MHLIHGLAQASGEVSSDSRWQHLREELLCPLFLHLQLLCSLPDQLLQVGRVLLQHPQHGVNDVGLFALVDELKLNIKDVRLTFECPFL